MRRYLAASICFLVVFAGYGCSKDKKNSTPAINGVSGSGKGGGSGAASSHCENTLAADLPKATDKELSSFEDIINKNSDGEFILIRAEAFIDDGDHGQLHFVADGFVDERLPNARELSIQSTRIICHTSVDEQKGNERITSDFSGSVAGTNRIDARTGDYGTKREIIANVKAGVESIDTKFTREVGNILSNPENDEALKKMGITGITHETAEGLIVLRIKARLPDKENPGRFINFTMRMTYQKRSIE